MTDAENTTVADAETDEQPEREPGAPRHIRAVANILGMKPGEVMLLPDHPDIDVALAAGFVVELDGGVVQQPPEGVSRGLVDGTAEDVDARAAAEQPAPAKKATAKKAAARRSR